MKGILLFVLLNVAAIALMVGIVSAGPLDGVARLFEKQRAALQQKTGASAAPAIAASSGGQLYRENATNEEDADIYGNLNMKNPDKCINLEKEGGYVAFHEKDSVIGYGEFGGVIFLKGGIQMFGMPNTDTMGAVFYNSPTLVSDPGATTDYVTFLQSTGTLFSAGNSGFMMLGDYDGFIGHQGATLAAMPSSDDDARAIVHAGATGGQLSNGPTAFMKVLDQDQQPAASISLDSGSAGGQVTLQNKSGAAIIIDPNGDLIFRTGAR